MEPFRVPYQLGNDVQIGDAFEAGSNHAERTVHGDLLKVRLREPCRVRAVVARRAIKNHLAVQRYAFGPDQRVMGIAFAKREVVRPGIAMPRIAIRNLDFDYGTRTSTGISNLRYTAALADCILQPSARSRNVPQEPEYIEKVRLARGVWPHEKHALLQFYISYFEISPVGESHV